MRKLTAKGLIRIAPAARIYPGKNRYRVNGMPLGTTRVPGNQLAITENLTEEANRKRIEGFFRFLQTRARIRRGDKVMTIKAKKRRAANQRARLKETIALEARQVQELGRQSAQAVMNMLRDVVNNPGERASDRIAAGNALLDRAYGKANQTNTNVNVDANGKATDVSRKELTTRIEETLKRVEELTGGAPKAEPSQERPADIRERDGDPGGSTLH